MDVTTLKARVKETTDQALGFVRQHEEKILVVVGGVLFIGGLLYLSTQPGDDENDNVYDVGDDKLGSTSYVEMDETRDSQTYERRDPPKRFIGEIETTGSRLKRNEKQFLEEFSAQYGRFKGKEQTIESSYKGWSSDGKYTRDIKTKHRFGEDKMSITVEESYKDDDGDAGIINSTVELKARNIINYVRKNRDLEMFDGVRDIVDLL